MAESLALGPDIRSGLVLPQGIWDLLQGCKDMLTKDFSGVARLAGAGVTVKASLMRAQTCVRLHLALCKALA